MCIICIKEPFQNGNVICKLTRAISFPFSFTLVPTDKAQKVFEEFPHRTFSEFRTSVSRISELSGLSMAELRLSPMIPCGISSPGLSPQRQYMCFPYSKSLHRRHSVKFKVVLCKIASVDYDSKADEEMAETRLVYLEERSVDELSGRILNLSRTNKVRSAMELFKSMEFSGLQPDSHACNSLVSCLLRNNKLDDASRVFDSMKAREMATGHTCSLILKAVADALGSDSALSMFEEMDRSKNTIKGFDAVVYNTMISVFSRANDWIQAEHVWRMLRESGQSGSVVTYRVLVCTFVRCGQTELALDAYREMIQSGLNPGKDEIQAVIGACMKEGKWDLAINVFQNMMDCGMTPNAVTCNAIINSFGKAGRVNLAFKVYEMMKSLGHEPDSYTWNALLGALNRVNRHADAIQLFESIKRGKMTKEKSVLSLQVYLTVLISYQKLGMWDRALQLLWHMEDLELSLDSAPYNLVIGACEAARQPKVALHVYDHMIQRNRNPDIFTLLPLLRSCIWGSLWDEVQDILIRNPQNGHLYNAAVQGLFLRGNNYLAFKLYAKMKELDLNADNKTRALVLQRLPRGSR